jgi:DNA-binding CsgD family transcriptional regulator
VLLDRVRERDRLVQAIASARSGVSDILVLRGEAGIGKTVLLDYAAESVPGLRVVRVVGIESDMELGYAGLHQLLLPFLGRLGTLPAPQVAALGVAFGLREGGPPDRLLVGLAALSLLSAAAAEEPLVCLVDDAQWLDRESALVLAFVARRLQMDQVAMLFAVRDQGVLPMALEGLPELRLAGLPAAEAHELLAKAVGADLDPAVGARIVAETAGNPMALVELGGELTREQRAGEMALPDPLPIGRRMEILFRHQIRRLPVSTQLLLLAAAADPTGDPELVGRAAVHLGLSASARSRARDQGLVSFDPVVRFRHPLIRSAVYYAASLEERRRVHAALAAATDARSDEDRRAWHLAASATEPDEAVALALEQAAGRARDRGGYTAVGAYLARSAELTPDSVRRTGRLLEGARAYCLAGVAGRAREMLDQARPHLDGAYLRGLGLRVEGDICFALSQPEEAARLQLMAVHELATVDRRQARETLLDALNAMGTSGRHTVTGTFADYISAAARAAALPPEAEPTAFDVLLDAFVALTVDGTLAATPLIRQAISRLQDAATDSSLVAFWLATCGYMANSIWEEEHGLALARSAVLAARRQGAVVSLSWLQTVAGGTLVLRGELTAARAAFAERTAIEEAWGTTCGLGPLLVHAWQGHEDAVRPLLHQVIQEAGGSPSGWRAVWLEYAQAILELGLGRHREAFDCVTDAYRQNQMVEAIAWPDVVEAASRCGELPAAEALLARMTAPAERSGTGLALGLLARSRALLASDDEAELRYQESIRHLGAVDSPVHLARTQLVYGEWLRRVRRRRDAREQLRSALAAFQRIGAGGFAERTRRELIATGQTAQRRPAAEPTSMLTGQEAQVARLAGTGATNPEIAAQLFISPRTVDYHLGKVFRKLSVSSRRQLSRLDLEQLSEA